MLARRPPLHVWGMTRNASETLTVPAGSLGLHAARAVVLHSELPEGRGGPRAGRLPNEVVSPLRPAERRDPPTRLTQP